MDKPVTAVIFKIIFTFIAAWIAFDLFIEDNPFVPILILGIVVAIINYIIGDMIILRRTSNVIASIVDGIMAGLIAYVFYLIVDTFFVDFGSVLFFAVLVALAEFVFHKYLVRDEDRV